MSVLHEDEIDRQKGIVIEMRKLNSKVIAERDEWRGLYEHGLEDRNALLSSIQKLREALAKWGDHASNCAYRLAHYKGPVPACDCGWNEYVASLTPASGGS